MRPFDQLLQESVKTHGHLCPGQVLGVRMAMKGCRLIGVDNPGGVPGNGRKMVVYVEIDRCATDAISCVTGCKLGKRTMKFKDYGIMAATFVNLETGRAFRVCAREEAKTLAARYAPGVEDRHQRELIAYPIMSDEELFEVEEVIVDIPVWDLPGRPRKKVRCHQCGAWVRDGREKRQGGMVLCQICAGAAYFRRSQEDDRVRGPGEIRKRSHLQVLSSIESAPVSWQDHKSRSKRAKL